MLYCKQQKMSTETEGAEMANVIKTLLIVVLVVALLADKWVGLMRSLAPSVTLALGVNT